MPTISDSDSRSTTVRATRSTESASIAGHTQRLSAAWTRTGATVGAWVISLAVATSGTVWYLQTREAPASEPGSATSSGSDVQDRAARPVPEVENQPLTSQPERRTLTDRKFGYQLTYPETWTELRTSTGHVVRIDRRSAFNIRTLPLQHPAALADLRDLHAVTDAILSSPDADITVLDVREIELAGFPAVYYLYYFRDGDRRGIHAHYFVFDGRQLHTLVFQVVPASRFADYASGFDQVVASFTALPH